MLLATELREKIIAVSAGRKHRTVLIGIDGFGGSGKSTIARAIREHFPEVTIVEMDDFYVPSLRRADFERVHDEVLTPLTNDKRATYQRYDWQTDTLAEWHVIEPGGMVVVEGVYSTHPSIAGLYDLKIWAECAQDSAMERGIARDLRRDNTATHHAWLKDKWLNEWVPLEREYAETYNPKQYADYVLDGTSELK